MSRTCRRMRSFAGGIIGETSAWTDNNERGENRDIFDIFDNFSYITSYFCWVMERKKRGNLATWRAVTCYNHNTLTFLHMLLFYIYYVKTYTFNVVSQPFYFSLAFNSGFQLWWFHKGVLDDWFSQVWTQAFEKHWQIYRQRHLQSSCPLTIMLLIS